MDGIGLARAGLLALLVLSPALVPPAGAGPTHAGDAATHPAIEPATDAGLRAIPQVAPEGAEVDALQLTLAGPALAGPIRAPAASEAREAPGAVIARSGRGPHGGTAVQATENLTGEELDQEDVEVVLHLNITNTQFDLPGILFGGGIVEVTMDAYAHVEFRAVAMRRIERGFRETMGFGKGSMGELFGVNVSRMVVTAEEMRLAGAVVLKSFQEAQARAAIETIEESLPGVIVLSAEYEWTHAEPVGPGFLYRWATAPPGARERGPPLVMDARFHLAYMDRVALIDTLLGRGRGNGDGPGGGEDAGAATGGSGSLMAPMRGSSAFELLGVNQVLDAEVPPGWRGSLTIRVPRGYTIVSATDDVHVRGDHREATVFLDGATDQEGLTIVTFSNRFLVVSALLAVVLLAGVALRLLAEPAARLVQGRRAPRGAGRAPRLLAALRAAGDAALRRSD